MNIPSRESYEGAGGWNDGRWGQAYDLIYAALKDSGCDMRYTPDLLHEIEMEGASIPRPGHPA